MKNKKTFCSQDDPHLKELLGVYPELRKPVISTHAAAKLLGVSLKTVYRHIKRNLLSVLPGQRILKIHSISLADFILYGVGQKQALKKKTLEATRNNQACRSPKVQSGLYSIVYEHQDNPNRCVRGEAKRSESNRDDGQDSHQETQLTLNLYGVPSGHLQEGSDDCHG